MSKLITMTDQPKGSKVMPKTLVEFLVSATDYRIQVLKKIPPKLQYNWKVEKINVLDEWDKFEKLFLPKVLNAGNDMVVLKEDFYLLSYFIYFTGSFYKHNGDGNDTVYVESCYLYLYEYLKYTEGEEYDLEKMFYNAFPHEKKD